jgi:DNA-binding NtrC family response regulator
VVRINAPPLRKSKTEIPRLIDHFIKKYATENHKTIQGVSREAMDLLLKYDYSDNVRKLENSMEQTVVITRGPLISTLDLPLTVRGAGSAVAKPDALNSGTFVQRWKRLNKN